MPLSALALVMALSAVSVTAEPDYVATLQACCGLPAPTVRSHAGRLRRDFPVEFPRLNGDVRSDYEAPGQAAGVTVTRNRNREVIGLHLDANPDPRYARSIPPIEAKVVRPVPAADVVPPLGLLDLSSWLPRSALRDAPHNPSHAHDFVAEFPRHETTLRRSGPWVLRIESWDTTPYSLVSDELGVTIGWSATHDRLYIQRFVPGHRFDDVYGPFQPALMNGRAEETLFGETCRWQSRINTPDSSEYECRTADGAVLGVGQHSMGFEQWEPAASFKRQPVPLASVLPPLEALRPEHYGLRADGR